MLSVINQKWERKWPISGFFLGWGGGFIWQALLVQRHEAANKYGAYLGLYSPPVGAVLEMGIEGLAISRLMRQTKPKLIRAESLRCSLFDLWLIASEWFNPVRLWSPIPHRQYSAAVIFLFNTGFGDFISQICQSNAGGAGGCRSLESAHVATEQG